MDFGQVALTFYCEEAMNLLEEHYSLSGDGFARFNVTFSLRLFFFLQLIAVNRYVVCHHKGSK